MIVTEQSCTPSTCPGHSAGLSVCREAAPAPESESLALESLVAVVLDVDLSFYYLV